jgi:hypothetical protein
MSHPTPVAVEDQHRVFPSARGRSPIPAACKQKRAVAAPGDGAKIRIESRIETFRIRGEAEAQRRRVVNLDVRGIVKSHGDQLTARVDRKGYGVGGPGRDLELFLEARPRRVSPQLAVR